jgi:hypothetical protein
MTADPLLQPLALNGGNTQTRALAPGSPAIDAGGDCPPPGVDQRGFVRPVDGNGDTVATCDIGAYEVGSFPLNIGGSVELPARAAGGGVSAWPPVALAALLMSLAAVWRARRPAAS